MRLNKQALFILILSFSTFAMQAQNSNTYDSLWKKADDLTGKKGLPKSALTEVDKIYSLAKKEKQDAQMIKALVYQVQLNEQVSEEGKFNSFQFLDKEIKTAAEPARSILNSLLAKKYLTYFQQHRYQFYSRTQTQNFQKDDVATWGINDFHAKIGQLYLASIDKEKLLQQTTLQLYEPVIIKGNTRSLRPTLYDLLANEALDYFMSDERDVNKPAYAFEIKDDGYFADAATFTKLKIVTSDSLSLHQKALQVYQQLLSFHAGDAKPDAFIDADILRLQFVHQYGVMEMKDELYAKALQRIADKYGDAPAAAQAWYLIANGYVEKAAKYDPLKDTSNRYAYIEAIRICEKVIQQNTESEGKANCFNLLNQIRRRELNLTTETVNVPGQPFRTLVQYRNFTKLYFRVVLLTVELRDQMQDRYSDAYWSRIIAQKPLRTWEQSMPATGDYQKHSAEVKVDALPVGSYMLVASVQENFSAGKNPLAAQNFYVSNISYVNNANDYFLLHRETGKPLNKATVQVWYQQYDYTTRRNILTKGEKNVSNENGFVKLTAQKNNQGNTQLEITTNTDHLFTDNNQYIVYTNEKKEEETDAKDYETKNARVFFFTDRSIYRPGQTVYFKGIAITKDFTSRHSKAYALHSTQVILYNANNEKTDSLQLTTNEFGSYSGKFTLPENVLNGEFHLEDNELDGETRFSVEEYKRPKFYVEYEKVKEAYRVNDSITITGMAKAYAGNNIDGAQVKYRVMRQPRFLYPWMFRGWYPVSSSVEITHGVATTDVEGKFTVHFKAIPDLTISKQYNPLFNYRVIADITDINGETRSGEVAVQVSYKALQISISNPYQDEVMPTDSLKSMMITTQNINGEFQHSLVHLSMYRLQSPERLVRKRYWQQPDQFVMNRDEFTKNFPNDEYQTEYDFHTWAKGEKVWETTDSTQEKKRFTILNTSFTQGSYIIEAVTNDKYGEEVKDVRYVQLYDEKSKLLPSPGYSWSAEKNAVIQPGETSTVTIGSSASDLFVIQQIDSAKNTAGVFSANQPPASTYHFISLNNEKKSFDFTAAESERGGFGVYHFFVKNNRFYFVSDIISVPWKNKELNISYETFRDKTLPGSEEKWKVKISGYKKEKVAAEMLASMYDASLDQFKSQAWNKPEVWPFYSSVINWNSQNSFGSVQSWEKYYNEEYKSYVKNYDRLLTPVSNVSIRIRGMNSVRRNDTVTFDDRADVMAKKELAAPVLGRLPGAQMQEENYDKVFVGYGAARKIDITGSVSTITPLAPEPGTSIRIRKNFNETAFFFPDLKTDAEGNIEFGFTMPEALTRWKFQALAHTKDAAFGYSTKNLITQKQLMVQPNMPRFLREGDHIDMSTKIVNLTDKEITGTVHLELLNAATMQPVDGWFQNMVANQYFTVEAGKSVPADFTVQVPYQYNSAIVYRFTASSTTGKETVSDGEEASIPVLKNSMLVTESVPLPMRGNTTKNFRFEKLLQSGASETLQQFALTVEYTGNPVWYAVQSLPYLTEYPYECAEQTFNRFYANALASKIANISPRLKAVFDQWNTASQSGKDSASALLSNLQKNQELKSVLLEETPWVLQAKTEEQQKKNIALLFDMNRMSKELSSTISKLQQSQLPNGGFPWFKGGRDDRYITQYILTGIGHLKRLGAWPQQDSASLTAIIQPAIQYLDKRIKEDYDEILKRKQTLSITSLQSIQINYLYMRSFFPEYGIPGESFSAVNFFRKLSQQNWLQQSKYMQGMIALSLYRTGDINTAQNIIKSLQQNAINNEETGMYWKDVRSGYYWYQAPVETQSLLIEAFSEINKNEQVIADLTTWLLKQKQTQNWSTTKATADACYALLIHSYSPTQSKASSLDWLNNEPVVEIKLGDKSVKSTDQKQQAGTGYFKKTFNAPFVNASMGDISIKIQSQGQNAPAPSWGAVYWQYFENLDKITSSATALQLNKKLFIESNSDRGPVLQPVINGTVLHPGTKIKVRIELRVDRDMEYVHMKDMRASCMEPVNVLSSYKWQGGLGYYETTRDASTNFFFSWLPKGTYVFEYPLFVTHTGNFSNGITTIQCMYAPEFMSHSEGVRVNVE